MKNGMTGSLGFDGSGKRRRLRYERRENEPTSVAVATALAEFSDEDVTNSSTRLYEYVDPDALDALFADRHDGTSRGGGRVRFDVEDVTVVVRPNSVQIYPRI